MRTPLLRQLAAAMLLTAGLATALPAGAALPRYTAIDLGQGTEGTGLNASGQVVGRVLVDGMDRAFITGPAGQGLTVLDTLGGPMSRATAVNDSGQVVGYSWLNSDLKYGGYHAFVTGGNGQGIVDLGTLGGIYGACGVCSDATSINNAGVVVGGTADAGHNARIFVARPENYTALQTVGSGNDWYYPGRIDNRGVMSGTVNHGGDYRPVLIDTANGAVQQIGDATDLRQPSMMGINDSGRVVGDYFFDGWQRDAFVTDANGGNLRRLVNFGTHGSTAYDINNLGWVVGVAYDEPERRAFLASADGGQVADLNSLVTLASGDVLNTATGINDQGWIVANSDLGHAWLLVPDSPLPVPEPATWALWLAGLALPLLRRRARH